MGLAARQRGGRYKQKTSDRLRGSVRPSDSDKRGPDFDRLKEVAKMRDNYACQRCTASNHPDKPTNVILTVDHIVPVASGGKNILSNMITLCNICHSCKLGSKNKKGASLLRSLKGKSFEGSTSSWGETWRNHDK